MGYAQNILKTQLANNSRNKDFGGFNVNNITDTQMNQLRNDIYGGYKTTTKDTFGRTGKDSIGKTGTKSSLNSNYYKTHAGWSSIGAKLGITNINSENDVRQMYDFVNGYKPPAAAASAPAAAAPAPLMPQISAASQQYRADTQALSDKIAKQQADFDASQAAAAKAGAIAAANQSRSGQTANLQIQPASSTPKTGGTQTFKKRKIASNRKQQLTSGINLGTSSLLNI